MTSDVDDSKASQSTSETAGTNEENIDEQLVTDLNSWIDELKDDVLFASENELFTRQEVVKFDDIMELLKEAPLSLSTPRSKYFEARSNYNRAKDKFNTAVDKAGRWWRVQYAYAIPYFLYLVAVLGVVLLLVYFRPLPSQLTLIPVPKKAIMWGVIGSVLQGLWALWKDVNARQFRRSWIVWFLAVPFIGGLLGAVMYLAFVAGFVAATKSTLQDPTVPLLVAALAGFSWDWAIGVLDNLTKIFKVGES